MANNKNEQGRKWQLTINNPDQYSMTPEIIKQKVFTFNSLLYFCFSYEIGLETKTKHVHIYLASDVPIRFSTLKKRFPSAHIERTIGTSQENRDYIKKEGKWENDPKKDTSLPDTFFEWGEMPKERQGERSDLALLYDYVKDGLSNYEILERCPMFMTRLTDIDRARATIRQEQYKNTFRTMKVVYISGATGTGKTRTVMEENGYEAVYRVTDYEHPFDSYAGQEVLVLDEFRSQLKISEMLNILDGYPLELRCRYANKVACFTTVYIIGNIPLYEQYPNVQSSDKETWNALLRRIQTVRDYHKDGSVHEYTMEEYLNGFIVLDPARYPLPFKNQYNREPRPVSSEQTDLAQAF
ncbi:MAG TPA: replication protein [Candidatus Fournierella merdavium]|nr:replication protein [Candidatus Fournierella merdavium]